MKLIFLDIDGVMNSLKTGFSIKEFSKEKIEILENIIDQTNAKIVLSSSWRTDKNFINKFNQKFGNKIGNSLIGITPYKNDFDDGIRGEEILQYLNNNPGFDNYVIIDDNDFDIIIFDQLKPHLVLTNYEVGLTKEDSLKVINILNSEDKSN